MQSSSDILIPLFFVTVLSNHTEKVIDPKNINKTAFIMLGMWFFELFLYVLVF